MPLEVVKYQYRKLFKLSAEELANEPIDQLNSNLYIWSLIEKKKELELKHGAK
jgi:hypothetical protein